MANLNSTGIRIVIFVVATCGVFLVIKLLFPQIIEQFAAAIIAVFIFLAGLIFRRKKSGT